MGASKNEFNKWRERLILDERETENYPPFDHGSNFRKKVKENWLTTEKLTELLQSSDYMEMTNAMIKFKMDSQDLTILMAHCDHYEPNHIKGSEYLMKVIETPLDNMKRVFKKYTEGQQYTIRQDARMFLETEIMKKERLEQA